MRRLLAITVVLVAMLAPSQAGADSYEVAGGLRDISRVPDSGALWMVKSATFDRLVSYTPGTGWTSYQPPGVEWDTTIYDVAMASDDDGWAVDDLASSAGLLRWDGGSWTRQQYDAFSRGTPDQIRASDPQNAWAIGHRLNQDGRPLAAAWRWTTGTWQRASPPGAWTSSYEALVTSGPDDTWITGSMVEDGAAHGAIWHWNGTTWTQVAIPQGTSSVSAMTPDHRWASVSWSDGSSGYLHLDGGSWKPVEAMPGDRFANDLDTTAGGQLWTAINQPAGLGQYRDGSWTIHPPPTLCVADAELQLFDVEAVSVENVYAVGQCVSRWGTYTVALHFIGSRWERI